MPVPYKVSYFFSVSWCLCARIKKRKEVGYVKPINWIDENLNLKKRKMPFWMGCHPSYRFLVEIDGSE